MDQKEAILAVDYYILAKWYFVSEFAIEMVLACAKS